MSRNRVKNSQSLHWMGVMKWILIAALLAGLGLSYMLRKNQNLHLADQALKLEMHLDTIQKRNAVLTLDLYRMKSMARLQKQLVDMHSTLVYWGDPKAHWERLDQNTRARLARIGSRPNSSLNLDMSPPTADIAH